MSCGLWNSIVSGSCIPQPFSLPPIPPSNLHVYIYGRGSFISSEDSQVYTVNNFFILGSQKEARKPASFSSSELSWIDLGSIFRLADFLLIANIGTGRLQFNLQSINRSFRRNWWPARYLHNEAPAILIFPWPFLSASWAFPSQFAATGLNPFDVVLSRIYHLLYISSNLC